MRGKITVTGLSVKNKAQKDIPLLLPDQHNSAFSEDCVPLVIGTRRLVHIGTAGLCHAAEISIPAFVLFRSAEDQLSPAVVDIEVMKLTDTEQCGSYHIVAAIGIGRESGWYQDIRTVAEYAHQYLVLCITGAVADPDRITNGICFVIEHSYRIGDGWVT